MKKLSLALVFALLISVSAFAGVQEFGSLVIDVPAGWTATQDGTTVGIVKNDSSASMSVTLETNEGVSIHDLATAYAKELNGTEPTQIKGGTFDGDWTFNFGNSEALISGDDKNYILIVVTGADNAASELTAMMDSIAIK